MIMPLVINRNNGIKKAPQLYLALLNMTKRQKMKQFRKFYNRQLKEVIDQLGNLLNCLLQNCKIELTDKKLLNG